MLGHTGEALAQILLLGCHSHRAVVGVANTGHHTTLSDHRDRTEAIFLGPQQSSDHHIPTRLEAAIGAQQHAVTQTVLQQRAVHLGETQLPGTASVLDGAQWRGAGAAVMAGNLDHISVGLRHTSGDGADADLGHQLHAHRGCRVHLMQVVNQLGKILDRIDVVVRRR